jgi:hypothetical protein
MWRAAQVVFAPQSTEIIALSSISSEIAEKFEAPVQQIILSLKF